MINFLKYRWLYALFSLGVFGLFAADYIYKTQTRGYGLIYSVDFTGGIQVLLGFSQPIHSEQVVQILDRAGIKGAIARDFSSTEILVRVREYSGDTQGLSKKIEEVLKENLPGNTIEIKEVNAVGQGEGAAQWQKSLKAIILALILMLLYTWWRFWSLAYGVGVLVSLFHDAIVILGFFLIFDYEISTNVIAAILAILGYSINDTIVIFARIRENVKRIHNESMENIVNISINETLRRTLLTSLATALVVLALLIFGGPALRTFALALLVGIVFGTYSSIAIASPIMLLLYKDKNKRLA